MYDLRRELRWRWFWLGRCASYLVMAVRFRWRWALGSAWKALGKAVRG